VNVVLLTPERIEEILERPYGQLNLGAWRGVDFRSVFVSRLVAAMSDDLAQDCPAGPLVGDSLTAALVAYLDAGPRQLELARSRPGLSAQGFERALQYIEGNLAQPLRIAELAKAADCSPKQLSRAFQEQLGMFPHQHVLERRVERASSLIDAGELSLAQVAVAVGFADQSQMTKIFRKLIGTTPGRLRKRPHPWLEPGTRALGGERAPE
jgi:AraC-like DNA-binding protein